MHRLCTGAAVAALISLVSAGAQGQTSVPSPGSNATVPDKTAPATNLDSKPGSLSDKLGQTNGVIAPTNDVDPAMHKPPPQTGNTPVVKPGEVPPQPSGTGKGGL